MLLSRLVDGKQSSGPHGGRHGGRTGGTIVVVSTARVRVPGRRARVRQDDEDGGLVQEGQTRYVCREMSCECAYPFSSVVLSVAGNTALHLAIMLGRKGEFVAVEKSSLSSVRPARKPIDRLEKTILSIRHGSPRCIILTKSITFQILYNCCSPTMRRLR